MGGWCRTDRSPSCVWVGSIGRQPTTTQCLASQTPDTRPPTQADPMIATPARSADAHSPPSNASLPVRCPLSRVVPGRTSAAGYLWPRRLRRALTPTTRGVAQAARPTVRVSGALSPHVISPPPTIHLHPSTSTHPRLRLIHRDGPVPAPRESRFDPPERTLQTAWSPRRVSRRDAPERAPTSPQARNAEHHGQGSQRSR